MHESGHRILTCPDYLLSSMDAQRCRFAVVDAQTYRQSAFLDHRIQPMPKRVVSMATEDVLELSASSHIRPAQLIIVHSSFCASTLLARMLDADDVLILREPQVLGQLANLKRTDLPSSRRYQRLAKAGISQLCKRYQPEQKLVLKPSNYANNLLPDMMRMMPDTRVLLLLGSLDDLFISMHSHAAEASMNLPKFLHAMLLDQATPSLSRETLSGLDLLQQTALLWHLQMQQFIQLAEAFSERCRLLSSAQLLADPLTAVTALDAWFGANRTNAQRSAAVAALTAIDAKGRGGASTMDRALSRQRLRQSLQVQINTAMDWARSRGLSTDLGGLHNVERLLR